MGFGRTVGGFNVITNYESFIISSTSQVSRDTPGGVYGMLVRPPYVFILNHNTDKEFQVYDSMLSNKVFEMSLGSKPVKMVCDGSNIFFATGNSRGFSILKLNN